MSLTRIGNDIISMKNCLMNKFKKNAYLFPLVILILFGTVFFLNEKFENFERNNIIIIFSIIMGLIILFNLINHCITAKKLRKMIRTN